MRILQPGKIPAVQLAMPVPGVGGSVRLGLVAPCLEHLQPTIILDLIFQHLQNVSARHAIAQLVSSVQAYVILHSRRRQLVGFPQQRET